MKNRLWPFYSSKVEGHILEHIRQGITYTSKETPIIKKFEEEFVKLHCPDGYGIFCGSGTAALFTAYFALGLNPEDEILIPNNTFFATATPLFLLNLRPVLCDVNLIGGISLGDAEKKITSRTKVLVVTHIWGQPLNMDEVITFVNTHNLYLVEDCSHAHGSFWNNKPVGSFGDFAAFSLSTKKMVSGGTGGILLTKNEDLFEKAFIFSQPTLRSKKVISNILLLKYVNTSFGANLRGNPISAILAFDHLDRLNYTIQIKNKNLNSLKQIIGHNLPDLKPIENLPEFTSGTWYSFQCIWTGKYISRNDLLELLKVHGIPAQRPNNMLHKEYLFQNPYIMSSYSISNLPTFEETDFPVSNYLANNLIRFDTLEMYDSAEDILGIYEDSFKKVAHILKQ